MIYEQSFCKNFRNIDRNETVKFVECVKCWSGGLWLSAEEKNNLEEIAFKEMYCNWILQSQIDNV